METIYSPELKAHVTIDDAKRVRQVGLSGISCVIGRLNIMPPWL